MVLLPWSYIYRYYEMGPKGGREICHKKVQTKNVKKDNGPTNVMVLKNVIYFDIGPMNVIKNIFYAPKIAKLDFFLILDRYCHTFELFQTYFLTYFRTY